MMHLRPDLVRDGLRENFAPASIGIEEEFSLLRAEGSAVSFGWQSQDLHPSGACGDATNADPDRGRRVVTSKAEGVARLIEEVIRFQLIRMRDKKSHG